MRPLGPFALALLAVVLVVAAGVGAGLGLRTLADHTAAPAVPTTAPTTTTTRGALPGPGGVQLSLDAAAHPAAHRIQDLLQRHFNAINNRDYAVWASTVVARRSAEMPEDKWQQAYQSSRDGSILVSRIEPARGGWVVLLTFTSTQDTEHAPASLPGSRCTRWWVSYRVVTERGQPRIDAGIKHTTVAEDCTGQL